MSVIERMGGSTGIDPEFWELLDSSNSSNSSKGDLGNTSNKSPTNKQISPAKRWCFTLNNYEEEDLSSIRSKVRELCSICIIGAEVGEEGTPHFQGYVEFLFKCRPKSHGFTERIHWEKCKGNREKNVSYCSKDHDIVFSMGLPKPLNLLDSSEFFSYQAMICDILLQEPEKRMIYWFYGEKGIGKTEILKVVCNPEGVYKACILPVTKRHALSQVQKAELCHSFVFNLTADQSAYQTNEMFSIMESVKDGLFSTNFGTDNNSMCVRNTSHIIVMANQLPDFHKSEIDRNRFNVYNIGRDFITPIDVNDIGIFDPPCILAEEL